MSKTLAEQLVGMLPEDWEAEAKNEQLIYRRSYDTFVWEPDTESPHIINWALDELAKMDIDVSLTYQKNGEWSVEHRVSPTVTAYPTKTLALAYALVEVARG